MPRRRTIHLLSLSWLGWFPCWDQPLRPSAASLRASEPAPEFGVVVQKNVMIPMRDGVHLAADIYRPARDGTVARGGFPRS